MNTASFLVRGLLAGLIAGVLTFGVAYVVGEGPVDAAIALEDGGTAAGDHHGDTAAVPAENADGHDHSHGDDAGITRATQSTWGLATGTVVFGTALGGILGLLSAVAIGRLGRLGVQATVLVVGAVGFVAASLVPFAVYPPNPPAVGQADTIGSRTAEYFLLLGLSVAAAAVAVVLARRLTARLGAFTAGLIAAAGFGIVVGAAALLLPSYNEVPADFPATVLWQFRTASLAVQAVLWTAVSLILGALLTPVVRRALVAERVPAPAA